MLSNTGERAQHNLMNIEDEAEALYITDSNG